MTSASLFVEIEIEVYGDYVAAERDRDDEPGHSSYVEFTEIGDVLFTVRDGGGGTKQVDMFAGVNRSDPAVARIIKNIMDAIDEDAAETLIEGYF